MAKYRIWWQSSTTLDSLPDYISAIRRHAEKILGRDIAVEIHGVEKRGDSRYRYAQFLNTQPMLENVIAAERTGCDAVVIGCFNEPGLHEAREIVDIPVLGLLESSVFLACSYGRKFTIVTNRPQFILKNYERSILEYGLGSRLTPMVCFDMATEVMARHFNDPGPVIDAFKKAAYEAVNAGAEVIIPGCGCLNLVLAQNRFAELEGATVLDVTGALMKMAEMMIVLQKTGGSRVSRKGYYEGPGEKLREIRAVYGLK